MIGKDKDLVLSTFIGCSIVYFVLGVLLPNSKIPLLVVVYIVCSMLPRLRSLQALVNGFKFKVSAPVSYSQEGGKFSELSLTARYEIVSAINSMESYKTNSKKYNDRRKKLFKYMTWRQQKLCNDVGYLDKLDQIDSQINANQEVFNKIIQHTVDDFGIKYSDITSVSESNDNLFKVTEVLNHYLRDWNHDIKEISPIIDYISTQLSKVVPENEKSNTCIIVPGSGLGRLAHELALLGYGRVCGVELSGLMYLCNRFIYSDLAQGDLIYPYIHNCSNFDNTIDQFRSCDLNGTTKPENLEIYLEDFGFFQIPDNFKNVVVVSAFFIDTAENIVDYIDSITALTIPKSKNKVANGYWINIGPLKYGTAPQVELNAHELCKLRHKMGWNDINTVNTLETPLPNEPKGLHGYITDTSSFWQGYYGLTGWLSQRKENSRNKENP